MGLRWMEKMQAWQEELLPETRSPCRGRWSERVHGRHWGTLGVNSGRTLEQGAPRALRAVYGSPGGALGGDKPKGLGTIHIGPVRAQGMGAP